MCLSFSCVQLFATLWTVARQAPLSMGFSRQEYWSGLPFPSPGDLSNPGIEPRSPALQADALTSNVFFFPLPFHSVLVGKKALCTILLLCSPLLGWNIYPPYLENFCMGDLSPPFINLNFPGSSAGKESTCNARNPSLIPGSGRSAGEGRGYRLQKLLLLSSRERGKVLGLHLHVYRQ